MPDPVPQASDAAVERLAAAMRSTREFQAGAAFGLPIEAYEHYTQALTTAVLAALTVADIPASLVAAIRADERGKISADIEAMSLADDFNHPYVPSDIRARAARLAAGVSQ